jgi:hypothetical protein
LKADLKLRLEAAMDDGMVDEDWEADNGRAFERPGPETHWFAPSELEPAL